MNGLRGHATLSLAGTRDRGLKHFFYQSVSAPVSLCVKPWIWRAQGSEFIPGLRVGKESVCSRYSTVCHLIDLSTSIITVICLPG